MLQTVFASRVCHPSNTVPWLSCREGHCHQPKGGGCAAGELPARSVLPAPRSCSRRPGDGAESPRLPAALPSLPGGRGATGGGSASRDHRPRWHSQLGLSGWGWGSAVALRLEPRLCRWGERGVREGRCRDLCVCVHGCACVNRDGGVHVCASRGSVGVYEGAWGFCGGCSACAWLEVDECVGGMFLEGVRGVYVQGGASVHTRTRV